MKYLFILLFLTCGLLSAPLAAQTQKLTGRIVDASGQPIPNATFYVREIAQGIMADERGEFQITVERGDYTCEISSLGYEKKIITLNVTDKTSEIRIELADKAYSLREVLVTPGKEDPAYRIMRQVIANAPRYLHQVKSYRSDVYVKGSLKIEKIPALAYMTMDNKEKEAIKNMVGKLYLYESQSEIKYAEPDKYELNITAISNSFPKDFKLFKDEMPVSAVRSNIYGGQLLGAGSFAYYKFKLEDSYTDGDLLIYKIRVIPKKKHASLAEGWLYIVDGAWAVQQSNLRGSIMGINITINANYNEVKPGAFLVTSYESNLDFGLIGIKASSKFFASIKYNDLVTNDNYTASKSGVAQPDSIAAPKPLSKKQQKKLETIEKLSSKSELTTRDAYKMAKLMADVSESDSVKKQKRELEIRNRNENTIVTRDSLALLRDSAFWEQKRTVPLQSEEIRSYLRSDSIRAIENPDSTDSPRKKRHNPVSNFLFGDKIQKPKFTLRYGGLLNILHEYNFVDGFLLGQQVKTDFHLNGDKNHTLSLNPSVYYGTARKALNVKLDGALTYAPMRNGRLNASAGNTSADFAGENNAYGRFVNTDLSLILGESTARLYQKRYATLSNSIDIANGLVLITGFRYEARNDLENHTSFNFSGKRPASNRPPGHPDIMPDHNIFSTGVSLQYTPRHRYRITDGRKVYSRPDYPTMWAGYRKAFGGGQRNSSFDYLEGTIYQDVRLNMFDNLHYYVNAGGFLSARQTYLPDFKHFSVSELYLTEKSLLYTFVLLENYRYATNDKWLQAHATFDTQYLLLKHIPFLQRYLFSEALHVRTLFIPGMNHNEIGYSIGLFDAGRVGVFAGFDRLKYKSVGVVVSIPLFSLRFND